MQNLEWLLPTRAAQDDIDPEFGPFDVHQREAKNVTRSAGDRAAKAALQEFVE